MLGAWIWQYVVPIALRIIRPNNPVLRVFTTRCVQEWLYGYDRQDCHNIINELVTKCPQIVELRYRLIRSKMMHLELAEAMKIWRIDEGLKAIENCLRR